MTFPIQIYQLLAMCVVPVALHHLQTFCKTVRSCFLVHLLTLGNANRCLLRDPAVVQNESPFDELSAYGPTTCVAP